jgi:hypothetical protein
VRLFADTGGARDGYECVELVASKAAAHVRINRSVPPQG